MHWSGSEWRLSPTDLARFLTCRHRLALDMAEKRGKRKRPPVDNSLFEALTQRGEEHERRYVESLMGQFGDYGDSAVANFVENRAADDAFSATLDAMRHGVPIIVQGALRTGQWYGRPDVLERVDRPSALGEWSYEATDTKLARETKGGTILQLGLYSQMLEAAQGIAPERFHVVTPDAVAPRQTYRVNDFAAYFRFVRERMLASVEVGDDVLAGEHYPEPVDDCEICAWHPDCRAKRVADDHLSLVAGITRLQRRELESRQIATLAELAGLPIPIQFKPERGSVETYVRVRHQARLQLESREQGIVRFEVRAVEPERGLCRLPEPSPGDVFLDLEGDPFVDDGGREYLFGIVALDANGDAQYRGWWALTERDERRAFEEVVDFLMARWAEHDGMHVYHYAPYEPSALKRLMGRYATRGEEIDQLLRAERFVDLYGVIRQALFVGVEKYSIKNLEPLYAFARAVSLPRANDALRLLERALETDRLSLLADGAREVVAGYNRDDCLSTWRLRDWLEGVRQAQLDRGIDIPRPIPKSPESSENVQARVQRVEDLRARLLADLPEVPAEFDTEQRARWTLAYLLDWHRREAKAAWWEYFRLCELPEEDLFDEPKAIAGLEVFERLPSRLTKTGKESKLVRERFRYPPQEMEIDQGDRLRLQNQTRFGNVVGVDRGAHLVDIEKNSGQAGTYPTAVFAHDVVPTEAQEDVIAQVAEAVLADGAVHAGTGAAYRLARDLLLRVPPRLTTGPFAPGKDHASYAVQIATQLDHTVLAIQGPPGTGKTYTGSMMIKALVAAGKRVGVTANSHKVIRNLLDAVHEADADIALGHKGDLDDDDGILTVLTDDNAEAREALASGQVRVLGGTSWLWARPEFANAVDVLFVDEAGQMSLANVLAVSHAAQSVVLLGDPRQLDQPQKGTHPEGVNASALGHLLGDCLTMPEELGLFLPTTWRLAPAIRRFTSELFYESRLTGKPGLEHQRLAGAPGFEGAGLWRVEVEHLGNRNYSKEEVDVVASLVERLTAMGSHWINEKGEVAQLRPSDILVVAPYNAQVTRLDERLGPRGVRVGTVDKFQGQQAPVVIYSMATSTPEDAPRGMEFLYSANRLNVATSRAQCAVILVASPRLFEPECRTPRQMQLANALCRFRELAQLVEV